MELNGLAGGEVDPGDLVVPDGPGGEGQLLRRHPAGGHPQPEHIGLSALLGVAAIEAGEALVGGLVQLPGVKRGGFFPEGGQVLLPGLGLDGVHGRIPPVPETARLRFHPLVYHRRRFPTTVFCIFV